MNCTNCGSVIGNAAAFCGSCGTPVMPAPVPPVPVTPPPLISAPAEIPREAPPAPSTVSSPPGFITVPPGFAAPGTTEPAPAEIAAPPIDDDAEATRFNPRSVGEWRLVLPDGRRVVVAHAVLVGRDPTQLKAWATAELVGVDDLDKSVSKTHAAFVVENGVLFAHDLNSTNGVLVTTPHGVESESRGQRISVERGSVVDIGSYQIRIE